MSLLVTMKKVRDHAREPRYATDGAAAMDLCACLESPVTLSPGGRAAIPTGLAMALPSKDYVALIFSRSGHGFRDGVTLCNSVGVIDADYRGEIVVGLAHHGDTPVCIQDGDRIAQMAILPVCRAVISFADELPDTVRGAAGFGSTGRR